MRRGALRGFTLIEMVMVILIISALAVYAVPKIFTTQSFTLPAVASQLAANIRYTQSLSMSQGQRYRINFTASTYQITDGSGLAIVQPLTGSTAAISIAPATLAVSPVLGANYIAFDTRGVPYVSAAGTLAATTTITLTSGSDTASLTVAPETGRVK